MNDERAGITYYKVKKEKKCKKKRKQKKKENKTNMFHSMRKCVLRKTKSVLNA